MSQAIPAAQPSFAFDPSTRKSHTAHPPAPGSSGYISDGISSMLPVTREDGKITEVVTASTNRRTVKVTNVIQDRSTRLWVRRETMVRIAWQYSAVTL